MFDCVTQILFCYFGGPHHSPQGSAKPSDNLKDIRVEEAMFLMMGAGPRDGVQTLGISLLISTMSIINQNMQNKTLIYQRKQCIYSEQRR